MLGRRGKADPGRHPVRVAPEAAENRFRVCQEQKIETFPKWNVSCRCRMPGNSRTPVKVRRRAAARKLLGSPDATPKQKRHLVDGVWVDKLPFSARDAWLAEQAEKARFKAEVEAWEAKEAESASPVKAEPVVHGEEIPAEKGWCDWTLELVCRCKRK